MIPQPFREPATGEQASAAAALPVPARVSWRHHQVNAPLAIVLALSSLFMGYLAGTRTRIIETATATTVSTERLNSTVTPVRVDGISPEQLKELFRSPVFQTCFGVDGKRVRVRNLPQLLMLICGLIHPQQGDIVAEVSPISFMITNGQAEVRGVQVLVADPRGLRAIWTLKPGEANVVTVPQLDAPAEIPTVPINPPDGKDKTF